MLNNFEYVFKEDWSKKVLIQIPSTHAKDFIPKLIEKKLDSNSLFSQIDIEYFIFDSESAVQIWNNPEKMEQAYWDLLKKIYAADKYIEIKDTTLKYSSFADWSRAKNEIWEIESEFLEKMKNLWKKQTPRLKSYLPTSQQAEEAWQNLLKYSKIWEIWSRVNVKKIKEAWEELIELLNQTKNIEIKWENSDIVIDIEDQFIMNSWWRTNMPWAEVFTSPKLHWVNWTITFDEANIIKMFDINENRVVEWISLTFEKWKVVNIDIKADDIKQDEKEKIISKLDKILDEIKISTNTRKKLNTDWQNRYTWEIAFGTTPHIIPWSLIHPLFAEKAFWMHIALWNSYKYKGMFNWNDNASFHWDIIWGMKWNTVNLKLKNWKTLNIMEDWEYNNKYLPKLSEYREKVMKEITPELKKLWIL